jgi:hypothetical protein
MARKRNYKAEYQRRRELGRIRNLSASQARGHARRSEPSISHLRRSGELSRERTGTLARYYRAVRGVASGKSLTQATKEAGIAPSTVHRLDRERNVLYKDYRTTKTGRSAFHRFGVQRTANYPILPRGQTELVRVDLDAGNASIVGRYWAIAEHALGTPNPARVLDQFKHLPVYDINGSVYLLETDPNALQRFFATLSYRERQEFYRLFGSERVVIRHAS